MFTAIWVYFYNANMTSEEFENIALSFPGAEVNPHFDRKAFKVAGKRIFATFLEANHTDNIKLNLIDQSVFCSLDKNVVFPVPYKWGLQGCTHLNCLMYLRN